jgi:hypothetical protein
MAVKTGRGALAAAALRAMLLGSVASIAMMAAPALAQTGEGTVTGVITSRTGTFLEGAEVLVPAAGLRAVTDRSGRFTLPAPAGSHDVVVRFQGQPDATRTITVAAGQATTLDVSVGAVVGQTVIVRASPIAESQAAALQVQRTSDSLVSVLSADAAGNFPDQNIPLHQPARRAHQLDDPVVRRPVGGLAGRPRHALRQHPHRDREPDDR